MIPSAASRWALLVLCVLPAAPIHAAAAAPDAIEIAVEGTLSAGGALKGSFTAQWRGRPAAELRTRLKGLEGSARDAKLTAMLPAPVTGKVGTFSDEAAGIRIVYSIDAPRFATAVGGSLAVPPVFDAPLDLRKLSPAAFPMAIDHDVRLGLPSGMVPASLPAAFSTVTPTGGRYLLYYDVEGPPPGQLIGRRALAIDAASLSELLETAAGHDAGVTLVPARPGGAPRP